MSEWVARGALVGLAAAALVASSPSDAQPFAVPGCEAAQKLPDGSWLIRTPTTFGRAGRIGAGAIVYRGSVINGVDLGAVLQRDCFRRYRLEPEYYPFVYPPNSVPNQVVPSP